ncbi:helix-turn-helix domain-containing protein [Hymenobacter nivis]|uniref:XRE family transcriptional regulator n=1 Tax=Hymenobacter nivis TaxID=1850093 RepID=A0A502GHE8_9BACT|nr:helix-turn-helix transcriptional regulator [Hymenobacter nivis]TPG61717.1 XRE family transcriptional regulator [Hymenobacter nivis]
MVDRIRALLLARQLSPTQFADAIGVARPIVSHILSGRNKPSLEVVQKVLAAFPDLSMPWLLSGTGPMLAAVAANTAATAAPSTTPIVPEKAPTPAPAPLRGPAPRRAVAPVAPAPGAPASVAPAPVAAELVASLPGPPAPAPVPAPAALPVAAPAPAPVPNAPVLGTTGAAGPAEMATVPASAPALPAAAAAPAGSIPPELALFAEPGKAIRRIVIFYRDGTFADYQPE